jgi:hypothetical protein
MTDYERGFNDAIERAAKEADGIESLYLALTNTFAIGTLAGAIRKLAIVPGPLPERFTTMPEILCLLDEAAGVPLDMFSSLHAMLTPTQIDDPEPIVVGGEGMTSETDEQAATEYAAQWPGSGYAARLAFLAGVERERERATKEAEAAFAFSEELLRVQNESREIFFRPRLIAQFPSLFSTSFSFNLAFYLFVRLG